VPAPVPPTAPPAGKPAAPASRRPEPAAARAPEPARIVADPEPLAPGERAPFEILRTRGMEVEIESPPTALVPTPPAAAGAPRRIVVPVEIDIQDLADGEPIEIVLQLLPGSTERLVRVSG
jgi:hypothetical protein